MWAILITLAMLIGIANVSANVYASIDPGGDTQVANIYEISSIGE